MAGDWIKMRNDLTDDPAVIEIASKLGLDEFAVVGRLHAFWAWLDEQSRDGHAPGVTSAWLDRKVQRDGFASALVSVGWLEIGDGGLRIPNFENHNGSTAKTRALGTRRKQRERASEESESVAPIVLPPSFNGHANGHAVTVTKARPEKRREEKRKENPVSVRKTGIPQGFEISERVRKWAGEKGYRNLDAQLEAFLSHVKRNGAKYLDWDEALMNAIRSDWAKTGSKAEDRFAGAI